MQVFKYKGYDLKGQKVDGEISANTIEEAERRIATQDVSIIAIVPAGLRKGKTTESSSSSYSGNGLKFFGLKKATDADIAIILRDLAVMAESGVPFVEALDAVTASARTPQIEKSLRALR